MTRRRGRAYKKLHKKFDPGIAFRCLCLSIRSSRITFHSNTPVLKFLVTRPFVADGEIGASSDWVLTFRTLSFGSQSIRSPASTPSVQQSERENKSQTPHWFHSRVIRRFRRYLFAKPLGCGIEFRSQPLSETVCIPYSGLISSLTFCTKWGDFPPLLNSVARFSASAF